MSITGRRGPFDEPRMTWQSTRPDRLPLHGPHHSGAAGSGHRCRRTNVGCWLASRPCGLSAGSEHALWDVPSADARRRLSRSAAAATSSIADLGIAARRRDSRCWSVCRRTSRARSSWPPAGAKTKAPSRSLLSTGRIYRYPAQAHLAGPCLSVPQRGHASLQRAGRCPARRLAGGAHDRSQAALSRQSQSPPAPACCAAVVAFTLWWHSRDQGLPATLQTTHVGGISRRRCQVKSKLGSAQIAYLSGRLIDPRGDNALQYYRRRADARGEQRRCQSRRAESHRHARTTCHQSLVRTKRASWRDGVDRFATGGSESSASRRLCVRSCWRCLAARAPKRA